MKLKYTLAIIGALLAIIASTPIIGIHIILGLLNPIVYIAKGLLKNSEINELVANITLVLLSGAIYYLIGMLIEAKGWKAARLIILLYIMPGMLMVLLSLGTAF